MKYIKIDIKNEKYVLISSVPASLGGPAELRNIAPNEGRCIQ